jgi:serine acetyltransferase
MSEASQPVSPEQLHRFKVALRRLWVLRPERLWLLSAALHRRGHWRSAFAIKQLNTFLFHNSLAPGATVSPDIYLGHNSLGIVVSPNVEIGSKVIIWHNVTLTAGRAALAGPGEDGTAPSDAHEPAPPRKVIIEDNVWIGANSVVIAPRGADLRIGRGARIGAGSVVTSDVPMRATAVGNPARVLRSEEGDTPAPVPAQASEGGRSPSPPSSSEVSS